MRFKGILMRHRFVMRAEDVFKEINGQTLTLVVLGTQCLSHGTDSKVTDV